MVFRGPHIMNAVSSMTLKKNRMYQPSRSLEDSSRVIGSNGTLRRPLMSRTSRKVPLPDARKPSRSSEEDADFEKQFGQGRFIEDSECTWLSSDCLSAASFFNQYTYLGSRQFVDEWLASWLSKVSLAKSVKSAMLDFDSSLKGDSKDVEAESWLLSPFESDASLSSPSLCDETISSDNASTQFSRYSDAQTQDLDEANLVLSLGLDEEFCSSLLNTASDQQENYRLGCNSSASFKGSSSSSSLDLSSRNVSGTAALDNDESEPIFWPFEAKFNLNAEETMKYLSMSPRRDVTGMGTPNSVISRKSNKRGCPRRKLQFDSAGSKSLRRSESSQSIGKTLGKVNTTPSSRFSQNPKGCEKIVPLDLEKSTIPPKHSSGRKKDLLGKEDFTSKFDQETPIEKLLGLSEFDGHEGVEAEFDGDVFLLDESLEQFLA